MAEHPGKCLNARQVSGLLHNYGDVNVSIEVHVADVLSFDNVVLACNESKQKSNGFMAFNRAICVGWVKFDVWNLAITTDTRLSLVKTF